MPNLNKISIGGVVYDLVGEVGPQGPKGDKGDVGGTGTLVVDENTLTYEENSDETAYVDPEYLESVLDDYYDKVQTESLLMPKANASDVNTALELKANASDVNTALELKANASDVNAALALKADISTINAELAKKANSATVTSELVKKADKTTVNESLNSKLDADAAQLVDVSGDYEFEKSSGNGNVISITAVKMLRMVNLSIEVQLTGVTNSGSNIIAGTLSGGPLPAVVAFSNAGFFGSSIATMRLGTDGSLSVRAGGGSAFGDNTTTPKFFISFLTND